jgi:hypothetical protein
MKKHKEEMSCKASKMPKGMKEEKHKEKKKEHHKEKKKK